MTRQAVRRIQSAVERGSDPMADSKALFRRNLKYLMRLRGLNNIQLIEALKQAGLPKHPSVVSHWKSGATAPDLTALGVIADVLDVPVSALFEDPDDDRRGPKNNSDPVERALELLATELGKRAKPAR